MAAWAQGTTLRSLVVVLCVRGLAATTAPCAPGQQPSQGGGCVPCPEGTFKDVAGDVACSACPRQMTSAEGAVECFCGTGFYKSSRYTSELVCSVCPDGGNCEQVGAEPVALPGFFRLDFDADVAFAQCPYPAACLGEGVCAAHHTGRDCSECEDGYKLDAGECEEDTIQQTLTAITVVMLLIVAGAIVFTILLVAYRQKTLCFAAVGGSRDTHPTPGEQEEPLKKQFSSSMLEEGATPSQWPPPPPPVAARPPQALPAPPPPPIEGDAPAGPQPRQVPPSMPPPPKPAVATGSGQTPPRSGGGGGFEPVLPVARDGSDKELPPGWLPTDEELQNY